MSRSSAVARRRLARFHLAELRLLLARFVFFSFLGLLFWVRHGGSGSGRHRPLAPARTHVFPALAIADEGTDGVEQHAGIEHGEDGVGVMAIMEIEHTAYRP